MKLTCGLQPGSASVRPKSVSRHAAEPICAGSTVESQSETKQKPLFDFALFQARFGNVPAEVRRDLDQYMQLVVGIE